MAKITEYMYKTTYNYGVEVYNNIINQVDAKYKVNKLTGMVVGSANDYINALICMLKGEEYHRTINSDATRFYLKSIERDFGSTSLNKALDALNSHDKYYTSLGGDRDLKYTKRILSEYNYNTKKS